jgi:hypothetical protein
VYTREERAMTVLSQADVARRLGCSPKRLADLQHRGHVDLTGYPRVGHTKMIPESDVEVIRTAIENYHRTLESAK